MDLNTEYLNNLYNQNKSRTYFEVEQLFEINFNKIMRLIPLLKSTYHNSVVASESQQDLHLFVENRFAHTGVFTLTHKLENSFKPDIKFKVFFDAKLVEVMSVCNETTLNQSHPYLAKCSDMDIKYEINAFMEKWLDFCIDNYKDKSWQTL